MENNTNPSQNPTPNPALKKLICCFPMIGATTAHKNNSNLYLDYHLRHHPAPNYSQDDLHNYCNTLENMEIHSPYKYILITMDLRVRKLLRYFETPYCVVLPKDPDAHIRKYLAQKLKRKNRHVPTDITTHQDYQKFSHWLTELNHEKYHNMIITLNPNQFLEDLLK